MNNNIEKIYVGSKRNPEVYAQQTEDGLLEVVWEGCGVPSDAVATIEECDQVFAKIQAMHWEEDGRLHFSEIIAEAIEMEDIGRAEALIDEVQERFGEVEAEKFREKYAAQLDV